MATRGATLKMVKEITVAFDPFVNDSALPIVREFVRRVSSPKLLESNPKFKLNTDIKSDGSKPSIEVVYADKEKQSLNLANTRFNDLYADFIRTCKEKE